MSGSPELGVVNLQLRVLGIELFGRADVTKVQYFVLYWCVLSVSGLDQGDETVLKA